MSVRGVRPSGPQARRQAARSGVGFSRRLPPASSGSVDPADELIHLILFILGHLLLPRFDLSHLNK